MLDTNFNTKFSIEATLPEESKNLPKVLLLRACKVYLFSDGRVYSELEEQTYDILNDNRGFGALDIEFVLENNNPNEVYPQFYTKCFVIRTDTHALIKPMKLLNYPNDSKVNQNGELVIGIRYYFRDENEIDKIINCNDFLVEGFIALGNPKNVFGIMCQLKNEENGWKITSAYTYKPRNAKNIKYLVD